MFRKFAPLLFWAVMVLPLRAEIPASVAALTDALGMPEIIDVMREEGIAYGDELADDMFPGRGGAQWHALVTEIYDADRMTEISGKAFAKALEGTDTAVLTDFFTSDLGRRIVSLEISARRALMDEAIEAANKEHVQGLIENKDPRIALLEEFISVNDLLESNIVGALNSNFAFYTGLEQGGAFPEPLTEDQILNDVWSQEEAIREETGEWLISFLSLAYTPLTDDELTAYIDISVTPEGQALNQALFVGFDEMFNAISHALGLAAAQMMVGEDL